MPKNGVSKQVSVLDGSKSKGHLDISIFQPPKMKLVLPEHILSISKSGSTDITSGRLFYFGGGVEVLDLKLFVFLFETGTI